MQIPSIEEGFVEQSLAGWLLPVVALIVGVVLTVGVATLGGELIVGVATLGGGVTVGVVLIVGVTLLPTCPDKLLFGIVRTTRYPLLKFRHRTC
jgi:hypothetical protein